MRGGAVDASRPMDNKSGLDIRMFPLLPFAALAIQPLCLFCNDIPEVEYFGEL